MSAMNLRTWAILAAVAVAASGAGPASRPADLDRNVEIVEKQSPARRRDGGSDEYLIVHGGEPPEAGRTLLHRVAAPSASVRRTTRSVTTKVMFTRSQISRRALSSDTLLSFNLMVVSGPMP